MRKCTPPMLMQTNTTSWPLVCDACCHSRDDQPRLTRHAHSKQPCPLHQPTTRVPLDRTSSPCPLSRSRRQRLEGSHGVKYLRNPKSAQAKPGQEEDCAERLVGRQHGKVTRLRGRSDPNHVCVACSCSQGVSLRHYKIRTLTRCVVRVSGTT